jgi:CubicO group peptidase (beta-lactamase class C family)
MGVGFGARSSERNYKIIMKKLAAILALALFVGCSSIPDDNDPQMTNVITDENGTLITNQQQITQITQIPQIPENPPPEPRSFDHVDIAAFEAQMNEIFDRRRVDGGSVAIFADGRIIHTFNRGYARKSERLPVDDNTKYRSASVAKMSTAIVAMLLMEQGKLDIDQPISEIMGINMDYNRQTLPNTTRNLLSHTSTIGDTGAYSAAWKNGSSPTTLPVMISRGIWTADQPGTRYSYSNLGSGLTAAVIESITGERFYRFAQENLFDVIGMDAAYLRTFIKDTESIANIYDGGAFAFNPRTWGRTESLYDKIPLGQSYGVAECELIISATDLARLAIILAGDGSLEGQQILSPKTVEMMRTPFMPGDIYNERVYALGLRVHGGLANGSRIMTGHSGEALGMISGVYFDPLDQTGVAIITNGASGARVESGMSALNDETTKAVYKYFFD